MILALRQRHRRMFAIIGVLLPITFFVGVIARQSVPMQAALPPELTTRVETFTATEMEWGDLFAKSAVHVRLWREMSSGRLAVGFSAPRNFLKPDLLVYWIPGFSDLTNGLPENAILLGAFVANPLPLPPDATTTAGALLLFSVADQEIVDASKPVMLSEGRVPRDPNQTFRASDSQSSSPPKE